jgi:mono/diheme cytochrome c family protein
LISLKATRNGAHYRNAGFRDFSSFPAATMRAAATCVMILLAVGCPAWGQATTGAADDVRLGHHLSILLCTACHVAAADQPYAPTMNPPAASFASIAQRADVDADSLKHFLRTTHEGLDSKKGMPNPGLADFQATAIVAYLLSLRK